MYWARKMAGPLMVFMANWFYDVRRAASRAFLAGPQQRAGDSGFPHKQLGGMAHFRRPFTQLRLA